MDPSGSGMSPQSSAGANTSKGLKSSPSGGGSTKMNKYKQKARKSIAEFFGVSQEDEKNFNRWEKRRARIASSIGRGLKDESGPIDYTDHLTDGMRNIRDPYRMSRQFSRGSTITAMSDRGGLGRKDTRKKSVLQMTMEGITSLSAARRDLRSKKSMKEQSFPPGSVGQSQDGSRAADDAFSLVDDVFFDEHLSATDGKKARPEIGGGPSAPGWRRRPPQPLPSTPGTELDQPDFGLKRIKDKVVQSAMKRDKRQMGMGILGRLMGRRLKSVVMTKDIKKQLDNLDDHRPYFTYWVTFVQIVVFIVSVSVYGIAPVGISTKIESKNVRMPNLAIQTEDHLERENLWIGPRQADLIHLGAKYSPCMRQDENLNRAIGLDKAEERESACCIRNDGSGCVQTVKAGCSEVLSRWDRWSGSNPGPAGRSSGSVCGQDPRYCNNPASTPPFEWPDDIISWPVHCFQEICGMIPFASDESPDQFYRLWTSLFLHGGLVHLIITIAFQMWIMRDLEKLMGAIRITIIYIGSGVAGNLASCTFIPYQVEAGPSGAQFGVAACLLVEVIQSYQLYRHPVLAVLKLLLPLLCFFILGLLPWFDNWAHIFGFLFGFLLAFALMPYITFGAFDRRRKIITILVCLGAAIGLFTILVIVFYVAPLSECEWCIYLNCIPFTSDFCANMAVKLKKNATYSAYI